MKESRTLEFKESITNTFLKTVSAFANYDGGEIIFGISDDGSVVGIDKTSSTCLDIENRINDSISPQPDYSLTVNDRNSTIILNVKPGDDKPYLYRSKAYKRNDTATIEVSRTEFKRLVLEGMNLNYESLPAGNLDLTFGALERRMKDVLGIDRLSTDVLKTLNLYTDKDGFSIAASILSDSNKQPGVDIAKFGSSINIINKRATYDEESIIEAYEKSIEIFRDYYIYDEIIGAKREQVEVIPEQAFREALANAMIHRAWDINAHIRISMFDDRIEIASPGGLPEGITEDDYLNSKISRLRNPILANVFYRLGIVELFGTGITRIQRSYSDSKSKPNFEFSDNSIVVTLPRINTSPELSGDETKVLSYLSVMRSKSISQVMETAEFGKSKVTGLLKNLNDKGMVAIEGNGRGTKYRINK